MSIKKVVYTVFVMLIAVSVPACSEPSMTPEPTQTQTLAVQPTAEPTPSLKPEPTPTPSPTPEPTAEPTPSPTIESGAPDVIGFYTRGSSRRLLEEFVGKWQRGHDIYIFDVYATHNEVLERNSHKALFESYWDAFPLADEYKIGYELKFTLDTGVTHKLLIRLPKDCPKDRDAFFYPYIEVYVYDNIHLRSGVKFYHLEEKTTYPYTLMTSIKLTPGVRINEVTAIELTTFIYKNDNDFDVVTGQYIGNVSYTIAVKREEQD